MADTQQKDWAMKPNELVDRLVILLDGADGSKEQSIELLRGRFDRWSQKRFSDPNQIQDLERARARFETALIEAMDKIENNGFQRKPITKENEMPKIILVIVAIVAVAAVALLWQSGQFHGLTQRADNTAIFELTSDTRLEVASGHTVERQGAAFTARATGDIPKSTGSTNSVFIRLSSDIEQEVSGAPITITVRARKAAEKYADEFAVAYSTSRVGNSGWQRFELGDDLRSFSFTYEVPAHPVDQEPENDFIGIWADTNLNGGGVFIESITIRPAEAIAE